MADCFVVIIQQKLIVIESNVSGGISQEYFLKAGQSYYRPKPGNMSKVNCRPVVRLIDAREVNGKKNQPPEGLAGIHHVKLKNIERSGLRKPRAW